MNAHAIRSRRALAIGAAFTEANLYGPWDSAAIDYRRRLSALYVRALVHANQTPA